MKSVLQFFGGAIGWVATQAGFLAVLPHGVQVAIGAASALLGVLGIRNAAQGSSSAQQLLTSLPHGKTIVGAIALLAGVLLSPDVFAVLPAGAAHVVQVFGEVVTALGLYHAQAQSH